MNTSGYNKTKEAFFKLRDIREKDDASEIWRMLENISLQRKNLDLEERKLRQSLIICGNNKLRKLLK